MRCFAIIALSLLLLPTAWGFKRPAESQHTRIELVSETNSLAPGSTGWLALRMEMDPGWHTYWINPGEFGETTKITWHHLPAGVEIGPIRWPAPHLYEQSGIINYVFEDEAFLLMPITLGKDFQGAALALTGDVTWLECDENQCVPGKGTVSLTLPARAGAPAPSKWVPALEQARQHWPQDLSAQWSISAHGTDAGFVLTLTPARRGQPRARGGVFLFAPAGRCPGSAAGV